MDKIPKSFGWAINGIRVVWREEINFRIEVVIAVIVLIYLVLNMRKRKTASRKVVSKRKGRGKKRR